MGAMILVIEEVELQVEDQQTTQNVIKYKETR